MPSRSFVVNENGKKYRVIMRGSYQDSVRSERRLRRGIDFAIAEYRKRGGVANAAYADALQKKMDTPGGIWDVLSLFGWLSNKWVEEA